MYRVGTIVDRSGSYWEALAGLLCDPLGLSRRTFVPGLVLLATGDF